MVSFQNGEVLGTFVGRRGETRVDSTNGIINLFFVFCLSPHTRIFVFLVDFREKRGQERERAINVRERHWSVASHVLPNLGRALTGDGTRDLLVYGTTFQPTVPLSRAWNNTFLKRVRNICFRGKSQERASEDTLQLDVTIHVLRRVVSPALLLCLVHAAGSANVH